MPNDSRYLKKIVSILETTKPVPESVDVPKVSSVKNQGAWGSCWTFSAVSIIESAYAIKTANPVPVLSEQNLINCAKFKYNPSDPDGCQGRNTLYSINNK